MDQSGVLVRADGRAWNELRPITIERRFTSAAPGSVLITAGRTRVLCTASVDPQVPPWLAGQGTGWITAEYSMLPGSTSPRKQRERSRVEGRSAEIQRLIGRSLRAVTDLSALGERTITVDCDVLQADGGTRTLSITGGFIALVDALRMILPELSDPSRLPLRDSVAAVSVALWGENLILDPDQREDNEAAVDCNIVMTGSGKFVEVQGTAERVPFDRFLLERMLDLAANGITQLTRLQREALGEDWPWT
ncbi:MAG: ribonuclease PH [Thermogutta sp.]|nr:ribonuclease PH [Thermogutta sp.]